MDNHRQHYLVRSGALTIGAKLFLRAWECLLCAVSHTAWAARRNRRGGLEHMPAAYPQY